MLVEAVHSHALDAATHQAVITALFDEHGSLLSHNPPFARQFGELVKHWRQIAPNPNQLQKLLEATAEGSISVDLQLESNQGPRWYHLEIRRQTQNAGLSGFLFIISDVHERKTQELKLAEQAQRDPLTGLLNRRGLEQKLQPLSQLPFSLFYIDLDGFKPINDAYGHQQGDRLLNKIAEALRYTIHPDAICARLGGDEFTLVIPLQLDEPLISQLATMIIQQVSRPHCLASAESISVGASVGVACYPEHAKDFATLLLCADAAMYQAKHQGRAGWVHYHPGMEQQLQRHTLIVKYLEQAIQQDLFTLFYQPVVNAETEQVVFVEALLHWDHPELGPIAPTELISVAEKNGKVGQLEQWVLDRACCDLAPLRAQYSQSIKVALNISASYLTSCPFNQHLAQSLAKHNCQPQDLIIEIRESALLGLLEYHPNPLDELVTKGFAIAIDDFGSGFSSLAYLNRIPASFVKIDKIFTQQLADNRHTITFIRRLCQQLGMSCIAEGVENLAQSQQLFEQQVFLQQGFAFARPEPLVATSFAWQPLKSRLKNY